MKFTFEVEQNDKLCFLNIEISRGGNKFKTSLYGKPTFSGIYTNFNSFIPMTYKCGLIHSLLFRVFNICANYHLIHEEIETLKTIWRKNCFPKRLIDLCIQIFLNKIIVKNLIPPTVPKKELFISLQYLGVQSLQVKRRLQQLFKDYMSPCKLKIMFNSNYRLRNFFSFKDRISAVIYKFTCGDCSVTYIGKTDRHFH